MKQDSYPFNQYLTASNNEEVSGIDNLPNELLKLLVLNCCLFGVFR